MAEAIKLLKSQIKCDAAGCDYVIDVAMNDINESWIGRTCPKCSAVMFTEDDFVQMMCMAAAMRFLNEAAGEPSDDAESVILHAQTAPGGPKFEVLA